MYDLVSWYTSKVFGGSTVGRPLVIISHIFAPKGCGVWKNLSHLRAECCGVWILMISHLTIGKNVLYRKVVE